MLIGIEPMHMLKKGQMGVEAGTENFTLAAQFYTLVV